MAEEQQIEEQNAQDVGDVKPEEQAADGEPKGESEAAS
jgi:hypothetical protein